MFVSISLASLDHAAPVHHHHHHHRRVRRFISSDVGALVSCKSLPCPYRLHLVVVVVVVVIPGDLQFCDCSPSQFVTVVGFGC